MGTGVKPASLYVVAAICARGGSKGIPRKNLRSLRGRPLIVHAIDCARRVPEVCRVVVSTDDTEIARVAAADGADVPFLRPSDLARDESSKWDVFRHLVESLEALDGRTVDVLVDLDTGVPTRRPNDVSECIATLLSGESEVVVTAYEADRNPYFNMVEPAGDGFMKVVKPLDRPVVGRQGAPTVYSLSPSVFAIKRRALSAYSHWSLSRFGVVVVPRERAVDIDTEMDFRIVECMMAQAGEALD
jgi:CMP-N,N'-diacetyllegionaminic acid synthase